MRLVVSPGSWARLKSWPVAFGAVYPGSTAALLLVSVCVVVASVGLALALLAFCRTAKQIDQLGLALSRPGPATKFTQALIVDRNDDDIIRYVSVPERQLCIIEEIIPTP